jgi:hypothetical protein
VVVTGQEQKPSDNGYFVQSATADATGASESQTVNRATNDLN